MIKACSFSQHVVLIGNYDDTTTTSQTLQYSYVYIIINPILQKIRKHGLSIGFLHFGVPITVSLYFDGGVTSDSALSCQSYSHLLLKYVKIIIIVISRIFPHIMAGYVSSLTPPPCFGNWLERSARTEAPHRVLSKWTASGLVQPGRNEKKLKLTYQRDIQWTIEIWLVVSTHLKNISQLG